MTGYVTSADGTRIAFDLVGAGPPVILVSGILSTRLATSALAEQLASRFSAISYDRRGRGESGDTQPYAVHREIEDIEALIDASGGVASVYGHSSGAGLALQAAARGLSIDRLVLHEPPYGADDDGSKRGARQLAEQVRTALADDRRGDAVALFFSAFGMPQQMVDELSQRPEFRAVAPTMIYDFELMGDFDRGGTIPSESVGGIGVPTLVLAGGASPDFFRDTAERIVALLPRGTYAVLEGQDHDASADVVAPAIAEFLFSPSLAAR